MDGEPDWRELDRQAARLLSPPWNYPTDCIATAVVAIKAGQPPSTIGEHECPWGVTRPCAHLAAAVLVRLVARQYQQDALYPQPPTVQERFVAREVVPEEQDYA